jgi:hypothetical protein
MATRESGASSQAIRTPLANPVYQKEAQSDPMQKTSMLEGPTREGKQDEPNLQSHSEIAPQVERVLRVFQGTIVKNK